MQGKATITATSHPPATLSHTREMHVNIGPLSCACPPSGAQATQPTNGALFAMLSTAFFIVKRLARNDAACWPECGRRKKRSRRRAEIKRIPPAWDPIGRRGGSCRSCASRLGALSGWHQDRWRPPWPALLGRVWRYSVMRVSVHFTSLAPLCQCKKKRGKKGGDGWPPRRQPVSHRHRVLPHCYRS